MNIPRSVVGEVTLRARGRCEYCQLAQAGQEATFHIDHIVPLAAGGPTTVSNVDHPRRTYLARWME